VSAATVIEVPERSVVLLVGAAGAGKSTFARHHFSGDAIISSDTLREVIAGDAADQRRNGPVFAAVHRALEARLAAGRLAVIDATNVTAAGRRQIRDRALRTGTPVIAIVFDLPAGVVRGQNAARPGRRVPEAIVERHLAALAGALERHALEAEGYARVVVLHDPAEVAGVRVRMIPTANGAVTGAGNG
jgi:protein phosphatase